MRIGDGVRLIQEYWNSCTDKEMLKRARIDHQQHLKEIMNRGYSWGLDHQLPFNDDAYSIHDIKVIYSILFSRQKKGRTKRKTVVE